MTNHIRVTRKRILLVEDQHEVRETVKLLLSMDQHSVVEAGNGREGLSLYQPGHFDLVITDLAMPEMRGDEMAARIKQLTPTQPVLMLTGSIERWGSPGDSIDALLQKPFGFEELRHAIAELCCSESVANRV